MILHVRDASRVGLHVDAGQTIHAHIGTPMPIPKYSGATEVTPTEETQTLETEGFALDSDITVNAIPADYVGSGIARQGAVEVTPTESAQTAVTSGKYLTGAVTVKAIPSNYVGSGITRRDATDMSQSYYHVTAPAGYYESNAVLDVTAATTNEINSTTINPTITVSDAGLVTADVSINRMMTWPIATDGWISRLTTVYATLSGTNTKQLTTVAGTTITPTESEQTAVAAKRYTTGNVKVGAIPSDYVGSQVPQKSSADLSASGNTVSVPAGYYAADASKAVDAATWKNASTVGVVPDISVDANGLITADAAGWTSIHPLTASGYADKDTAANIQMAGVKTKQLDTLGANSYTPTKQTQTINGGVFLTGAQTINPIPDNYYDMSAFMSFLGKDVECVIANAYTKNFALKDTDWHGWTPSTTAQVLIASVNASQTFTATDMVNNEYFIVWECGVTPVYNSGYTDKARPLKSRAVIIQELCRRPSTIGNVESANFNGNVCVTANSSSALTYWNAATTPARTITWSASYGFYFGATAATFSNSTNNNPTVTIKTPTLTARCSTTYMSTANAGLIDEDNSTGFIKASVYRIKRNGEFRSVYEMLVAAINA